MRDTVLSKAADGSEGQLSSSRGYRLGRADPHTRRWAAIAALVIVFILYGSLYPFDFRWDVGGPGPLHALLQGWRARPGRGDFVANVLLYMPLGFFFTLAARSRIGTRPAAVLAVLIGGALSLTVENLQYFDPGRITAASDVYSNVMGAAVGAGLALFFGGRIFRQFDRTEFQMAPLLLLLAWATDRLYPFIPVIDLHKYWNALKPIIFLSPLSAMEIFRHIAIWWTVALLLEKVSAGRRPVLRFAAFAAALVVGQIFVMDGALSKAELSGIVVALVGAALLSYPVRLNAGFACLLAYVLLERLTPFQLRSVPAHFGWIPFESFMYGSLTVNALAFLEKSLLYGSLIWLLQELGASRPRATVTIGLLLVLTAFADIYVSDHAPQITDPFLAVLIGCVMPGRQIRSRQEIPETAVRSLS
jgi:hypothetical protein